MHQQPNLAKANAALTMAYEQAIYEVYYGQETIKIYIGEYCRSLDYLIAKCDYPAWALITAANPYSQPLSELENQQRQQKLIEYLQELPWSWLDALGKDRTGVWTPEPSLLLLGIDRIEAIAVGRKFEQNALVYGELNQPAELQWLTAKSY
ncbi:MAG: DUF3293 domain-containing protein [Pleurocapsa sp. SU_5_0]|nr:DUF3293 domain-containing protein [Pleurocapsa sp. SU_5_0]NJO94860.1 DUF3293 domain-containing protein [Pleurocapsa sp. CRU_1_2]NJR45880.1 DUF3293 domain-containing protein [Hyellaceae cyanobacterium CSU_1_1]